MKLCLSFHNSCEIGNLFSWAHIRNCLLLVLLQIANYNLLLKIKKKKNAIWFRLSGTRICPLNIKITQFPDGFRLKSFTLR